LNHKEELLIVCVCACTDVAGPLPFRNLLYIFLEPQTRFTMFFIVLQDHLIFRNHLCISFEPQTTAAYV
jgi:hypothetical protein